MRRPGKRRPAGADSGPPALQSSRPPSCTNCTVPCVALRCVVSPDAGHRGTCSDLLGSALFCSGLVCSSGEARRVRVGGTDGGGAPYASAVLGIIIEHHPTVVLSVGCSHSTDGTCGTRASTTTYSTNALNPLPGLARESPITGNATTTRTPKQQPASVPPTASDEWEVPSFPRACACSGAKRICSFQLRRYLVVWSCTLGSTAQPSKSIGRKNEGDDAAAFCALLAEARKREAFPFSALPCFARQADGFSLCATGGPTRVGFPPSI